METVKPIFLDFPDDDRFWWIRWVDDIQLKHRGTTSASATAYLSPMLKRPEEYKTREDLIELVRTDKGGGKPFQVHIGAFPVMALGTIVHRGMPYGHLALEERELSWNGRSRKPILHRVTDLLESQPKWTKRKDIRNFVLGDWEYHLPADRRERWVLHIEDDDHDCILPCPEVFRTFYAWHSRVARAVTNGPFGITCAKLIVPDCSGDNNNGDWRLKAARGFEMPHCRRLALGIHDLDAMREANSVFTSLTEKGRYAIRTNLPSQRHCWKIWARGLPLNYGGGAKFFVMQIVRYLWPRTDILLHSSLNPSSTKGKVIFLSDKEAPPPSYGRRGEGERNIVVDSDEDATEDLDPVSLDSPSCEILGTPEVEMEKDFSTHYLKRRKEKQPTNDGGKISLGNPWSRGDGPGGGELSPARDSLPGKFAAVIAAFRSLAASEKQFAFRVVRPPANAADLSAGYFGWFLPKSLEGSHMESEAWRNIRVDGKRQPRTALVVEAHLGDKLVYYLELETRHWEMYRSLVFRPRVRIFAAVNAILRLAIESKGVWKKDLPCRLASQLQSVRPWIHVYKDKAHSSLNSESLLRVLREVSI